MTHLYSGPLSLKFGSTFKGRLKQQKYAKLFVLYKLLDGNWLKGRIIFTVYQNLYPFLQGSQKVRKTDAATLIFGFREKCVYKCKKFKTSYYIFQEKTHHSSFSNFRRFRRRFIFLCKLAMFRRLHVRTKVLYSVSTGFQNTSYGEIKQFEIFQNFY